MFDDQQRQRGNGHRKARPLRFPVTVAPVARQACQHLGRAGRRDGRRPDQNLARRLQAPVMVEVGVHSTAPRPPSGSGPVAACRPPRRCHGL